MTNTDKWTPFIRAVAYTNDHIALAILNSNRNIDLNHQDFLGNSALMFLAVRQTSSSALENNVTSTLIRKGADMNLKNKVSPNLSRAKDMSIVCLHA